jgi:hypothetical protein
MPTGVFTRRKATVAHKCPVCGKEYKHEKRFHNHLHNGKCTRATTDPKVEEPVAPTNLTLSLLARVEALEARNKEKDEIIAKLVSDLGNVKRSLYYVRDSQKKVNQQVIETQKTANEDILKSQEALKVETNKLHHQKFWFKLKQQQTQT